MTSPLSPFHLAIPVDDLTAAAAFYEGVLGLSRGREAPHWIDLDFWGHQVVLHQVDAVPRPVHNPVDGDAVGVPHFGIVLDMPTWRDLADRLTARGVTFVIEPRIRFAGRPGEQGTFFLRDPAGNHLEFKGFARREDLFRRDPHRPDQTGSAS